MSCLSPLRWSRPCTCRHAMPWQARPPNLDGAKRHAAKRRTSGPPRGHQRSLPMETGCAGPDWPKKLGCAAHVLAKGAPPSCFLSRSAYVGLKNKFFLFLGPPSYSFHTLSAATRTIDGSLEVNTSELRKKKWKLPPESKVTSSIDQQWIKCNRLLKTGNIWNHEFDNWSGVLFPRSVQISCSCHPKYQC